MTEERIAEMIEKFKAAGGIDPVVVMRPDDLRKLYRSAEKPDFANYAWDGSIPIFIRDDVPAGTAYVMAEPEFREKFPEKFPDDSGAES